jgi:hypothetical protein
VCDKRAHTQQTEVAGATREEEEEHYVYLRCMGRSATEGKLRPMLFFVFSVRCLVSLSFDFVSLCFGFVSRALP